MVGVVLAAVVGVDVVTVGSPSLNVQLPAVGRLRCTYYQPIELATVTVAVGSWSPCAFGGTNSSEVTVRVYRASGDPVVGSAAEGAMPIWAWAVPASTASNPYESLRMTNVVGGDPALYGGGADPDVVLFYQGSSLCWWNAQYFVGGGPANWDPDTWAGRVRVFGAHGQSYNRWAPYRAGTPSVECSSVFSAGPLGPAPTGSGFEVWISPRFGISSSNSAHGWIEENYLKGLGAPREAFLWVRYEVAEGWPWSAAGGSGDCCTEILSYLQSIDGNVANLWSSWIEEFLPAWQAQDLFFRQALNSLLEYDNPTGTLGDPGIGDRVPSAEQIAGAVSGGPQGLSRFLVSPSSGLSGSDSEHAPVWSFTLPVNPLASEGIGESMGNRVVSVDFGSVPAWDTVIAVINAAFLMYAGWYVLVWMWEELRKYG